MSAVKSACAVYETHKEKQCILRQCLGALHNIQRREQQQTAELCMAKIDRSFLKHFPARILSKHCLLSPFEWPGRINWPASTECDLVYTPVPASKACLYKGFRTTLDAVRCRRRCNVHSCNSHQLYWQSTSWLFAAILMIPAKYFCLPAACKNKGYINSANVIARRWQTHCQEMANTFKQGQIGWPCHKQVRERTKPGPPMMSVEFVMLWCGAIWLCLHLKGTLSLFV